MRTISPDGWASFSKTSPHPTQPSAFAISLMPQAGQLMNISTMPIFCPQEHASRSAGTFFPQVGHFFKAGEILDML